MDGYLDGWWSDARKRNRLQRRVVEAMREVGVLLIAFTPLDIVVSDGGLTGHWGSFVLFFGVGVTSFFLGVIAEWEVEDAG